MGSKVDLEREIWGVTWHRWWWRSRVGTRHVSSRVWWVWPWYGISHAICYCDTHPATLTCGEWHPFPYATPLSDCAVEVCERLSHWGGCFPARYDAIKLGKTFQHSISNSHGRAKGSQQSGYLLTEMVLPRKIWCDHIEFATRVKHFNNRHGRARKRGSLAVSRSSPTQMDWGDGLCQINSW